jgi:hypothetical protein
MGIIQKIDCYFGWHKPVVIKTVSYLEYMYLAIGDHIKDMTTIDLVTLMDGLFYRLREVYGNEVMETRFIALHDGSMETLFDENEAMQKHIEFFRNIAEEHSVKQKRLLEIRKISGYIPLETQRERDELDERVEEIRLFLYCPKLGFKVRFCPDCKKTFDVRDDLGKILPELVSSLKRIQMNEKTGVFLLPNKGVE